MTTCGERKAVDGGTPLTCNLEAGHELPHGVRVTPTVAPFVVWPTPWTAADQARREERLGWRKGHVRRPYQTAAMWKAERGL